MKHTYVLVHGAWHTGAQLEPVAQPLRDRGHTVYCPTAAGNRADDQRSAIGLREAIDSIVEFIATNDLSDLRLVGHSYGGMLISGVADRMPDRIRRLVYVNAFVPLPGECLNDMVPATITSVFEQTARTSGNQVMLPYAIWREAFINDADDATARASYGQLNPHPYRTFTEPIVLGRPLAELAIGRSYVNCLQDTALPHSMPWHPRLSERLGLFRLVECPGSHELLFTDPVRLADAIEAAARD